MGERYHFESRWLLESSSEAAYDVLVDVQRYPEWWPQVRAVATLGENHGLALCRSVLPFNLYLELRPVVRDRAVGLLEVSIDGDLTGWSRFTLTPEGRGLEVHYEQEVEPRRRLLRLPGWATWPVRANHAWMMRCARRGLAARVSAAGGARTSESPA